MANSNNNRSRFGAIPHSPISLLNGVRGVDKCFEEAEWTCEILLSSRQLKEFPKSYKKYDLKDCLFIDISKNSLVDFPRQIETFTSLETLNLSSNILRSLPLSIEALSCLVCLNLNRNLLSTLPRSICSLVHLEVLTVRRNKLVSVPEEIGRLQKLMLLDVSHNQLSHLPSLLGSLKSLESLDLSHNLLVELPTSLSMLKLKLLDFSSNRVASIPVEFGKMESLEVLGLQDNPLVSPPATVCSKGLVHIFKILNYEAAKDERRRGHLYYGGNNTDSPKFPNKRLAGSTNNLYHKGYSPMSSSPSSSLTTSPSMSSLPQPPPPSSTSPSSFGCRNASLPPQPKQHQKNADASRLTPKEESNLGSSLANGTVHNYQTQKVVVNNSQYLNGFTSFDSSTLGRRKSAGPCDPGRREEEEEAEERRRATLKLLNQVRRRRMSNGNERMTNSFSGHVGGDVSTRSAAQSRMNSFHVFGSQKYSRGSNGEEYNNQFNDSKSRYTSLDANQQHQLQQHRQHQQQQQQGLQQQSPRDIQTPSGENKNVLPLACRRALEAMTRDLNDLEPGFTVRRTRQHAREEEELVLKMKHLIEKSLNVRVPGDVGDFLKDGVVLCRMLNYCFPQTISTIHVPPQQQSSGLSVAKCRMNVDNFLVSCHMVGLERNQICSAPAILDQCGTVEVARTVILLIELARGQTSV